jgi:hypothetical protein
VPLPNIFFAWQTPLHLKYFYRETPVIAEINKKPEIPLREPPVSFT